MENREKFASTSKAKETNDDSVPDYAPSYNLGIYGLLTPDGGDKTTN